MRCSTKRILLIGLVVFCAVERGAAQTRPLCRNRTVDFHKIEVDPFFTPIPRINEENNTLELFVEVEWSVRNGEGISIDGFAVHFLDTDTKRNGSIPKPSIAPSTSCISGADHIWFPVTDQGSCDSSVNISECSLTYPDYCLCPLSNCTVLPALLRCGSTLDLYKAPDYFRTIPFTTLKLRYRIEFHKEYEFTITPYYRQFSNAERQSKVISVDDCEGLLENVTESRDVAKTLCCEQGAKSTVAYNVTVSKPHPVFSKIVNGTLVNVTLSWFPPDTGFLSGFFVSVRGDGKKGALMKKPFGNGSTEAATERNDTVCSARKPDSRWEVELYDLVPGTTYSVQIRSNFSNDFLVTQCSSGRCYTRYEFVAKEPDDLCTEEFGLCDSNTTCKPEFDFSTGRNATCECGAGLEGDGLNTEIGAGCHNTDHCLLANDCSEFANCKDLPAPSIDVKCTCKDGYYGDGRKSGSQCTSKSVTALAIALPVVAAVIIIIVIVALCIARKREENRKKRFQQFIPDTDNGILMSYVNPGTGEEEKGPFEPSFGSKWEIDRKTIHFGKVLGRGNYGVVHFAWLSVGDDRAGNGTDKNGGFHQEEYHPLASDETTENDFYEQLDPNSTVVAVKHLQESTRNRVNLASFVAEIGFMLNIGNHDNILRVHGCSTTEQPVYLITEYLRYGDLLHLLWDAREPSAGDRDRIYKVSELSLCNMAGDVVKGMSYLQQIRVIHGDIAARNILVGENGICKLSDFGLANDVYRYGAIKGHKERFVPFKWVSPERMMSGRVPITAQSDVWSFGNLMYEMFTLGCPPHPGVQSSNLLGMLESGYRMMKPNTCNDEIYKIMTECWKWRPSSRPTFTQLKKSLDTAIHHLQSHGNQANMIDAVEQLDREQYANELARIESSPKDIYVNGNAVVVENEHNVESRAV